MAININFSETNVLGRIVLITQLFKLGVAVCVITTFVLENGNSGDFRHSKIVFTAAVVFNGVIRLIREILEKPIMMVVFIGCL